MALDERFVVSSDIEHWYVNKDTGEPLANGTVSFYRDIARNVPKPVYQLSGSPPNYTYTSMGSVLTLSAVGTVQNAGGDNEVIYYFPFDGTPDDSQGELDLYYIVVEDAGGTVQFTREAWPNVTAANSPADQTNQNNENQIANPTFTNTFLNPGIPNVYNILTADGTKTFEFAPDWDFIITGNGSVTVQIIPITGSQNTPTNPPYSLDVTVSSGITSCFLNQRFPKNSGLWTSTVGKEIFLYGSFVAQNQNAGTGGIVMLYKESTPAYVPVTIVDGAFTTPYEVVMGTTAAKIPFSADGDSGINGYVDIYLSFQTPSHVRVTSIQVVPSVGSPASLIAQDFNSSNRDEAFQGDYYLPRAAKKNIDSYLVGWDFPMNPFQFGSSGSVTTTPAYIADQTIAASATSAVTWTRNAVTTGLNFQGTGTDDAFYILQYLSGSEVKDMLGNRLSANVFAYQNIILPISTVSMQVYLFRAPSPASVPTLPLTIGTILADGTFTLTPTAVTDGWTQIPRSGLPTPKVTLNQNLVNSDINKSDLTDSGFSGWELTDSTQVGTTTEFAMVVTFKYVDVNSNITVNSISCVPGDLPCRPAVKTFEETLLECQYYYEKSYEIDIQPGSVTNLGIRISNQMIFQTFISPNFQPLVKSYPSLMTFNFKTIKRVAITPAFYSISGTLGSVLFSVYSSLSASVYNSLDVVVATYWTAGPSTRYGFALTPPNFTTFLPDTMVPAIPANINYGFTAIISFQYVADARIGTGV